MSEVERGEAAPLPSLPASQAKLSRAVSVTRIAGEASVTPLPMTQFPHL